MWTIIFVLSTGATAVLHAPTWPLQKHADCLEYAQAVAEIFNTLSADVKLVSGQCKRRA